MKFRPAFPSRATVNKTGARAGAVLVGAVRSNAGLRIKVLRRQPKGDWGPISGPLRILDVGNNIHSSSLEPLLGQLTDAATVLHIIRQEHRCCVNVVNTTNLALDEPECWDHEAKLADPLAHEV